MKIIVGLGNPGKQYEKTRHNTGRIAVENLARVWAFPKFRSVKRFKALISRGQIDREKIILALPQTFMNESGMPINSLAKYYKIKTQDIWIIYDDIDLPLGKIRIRRTGTAGGHKGIESIIKNLGNKDFARFRVGIAIERRNKVAAEKFVLEKFTKKEKIILDETVKKVVEAIQVALKEGLDTAMSKFN